jgi:hypothetical protein
MLKILLASAGLIATAALAETADNAPTTKRGPSADPDEVVCINQSEIGSRLSRRRVCRTRAEWAEHQRQYRVDVEQAQQQLQSHCASRNPNEC